jgi:hypothetical protein
MNIVLDREYQFRSAFPSYRPAFEGGVGVVVKVNPSAGTALFFVNEGRAAGAAVWVGIDSLVPVPRTNG